MMILRTKNRRRLEIRLDMDDYIKAKEYQWKNKVSGQRYIIYTIIDGKMVYLKNFLFSPEPNQIKLHINVDKLDYRRDNIKFITRKELGHIKGSSNANKSSRYNNVYYCTTLKRWLVRHISDGEIIKEHAYKNEYEAAIAAEYHSIKIYKKRAKRNFPELSYEAIESIYIGIRAKYGVTREDIKSKSMQGVSRKKKTTSKYVGVTYDKRPNRKKRWVARIKLDGKTIHLGSYERENEAAKAYDAKAVELYGEHAKTNFDKEGE